MSAAVSPDDYELNDTQRRIRASCVVMFCISVIFVALRCFVRVRLQAQFNVEDWLLVIGLIGFLVMTVMILFSINEGGFGRKTAELSIQTFYTGTKYLVLAQAAYALAMLITKLSIALLQLRIIGQTSKIIRRINYGSIAVNAIIGIYAFFALLFQCTPPEKFWTPTMTAGHCADRNGVTTGVYISSAANLVLDWYYALALVPLVWRLQMRMMVKLSTILVLGVGVFASLANIIRFKSLIGYSKSVDQLYIFIPIAVWTWAEMCLALCAAALATFRPLIRLLPWGGSRSASNKYSEGMSRFPGWETWRTPRRHTDPMELSDISITNMTVHEATSYANQTQDGEAGRPIGAYSIGDAESQKYILKEQAGEGSRETWE
ncbi:hypothetical protein B0J12DRAFT_787929 [Macrophomina phaseolina]|uniref:Rhodopsin domain-containing protein n=1 Tax=Macrophomina phaseolina TaxID=35725 RepID=A0ABQ8G5D2_9PEZI|nr:hypothetical protein B0J12DRAFT_787929 [Macrophomina phaseolina]